ncbi:alpha/beta hydrolase [Enterococcus mundtii]|uniref:Phospholipase n=1 Tax=Enterococcus mundtii TaxID=53346 RepID=A0A2S7RSQ6_ENTMU|nr:alpha/beta hydrolase [Enterococcus mundtii]OBS61645.1 phospholipase [Enterococcus mundtii]PQF22679.1 phospholipase [Enterococcus mundtii]
MKYLYRQGKATQKKLILLHGTGGDEHSLLEIAEFLAPESTLLSFRGNINEQGLNRFFKRNGLNQFDYESLAEESTNLYNEIKDISRSQDIPLNDWIVVGFSNGANIAAHIMLDQQTELKKGLFFHPMSLNEYQEKPELPDTSVWLSFGEGDPIVSNTSFSQLVREFDLRGAKVTTQVTNQGHQLTLDELTHAKQWLDTLD